MKEIGFKTEAMKETYEKDLPDIVILTGPNEDVKNEVLMQITWNHDNYLQYINPENNRFPSEQKTFVYELVAMVNEFTEKGRIIRLVISTNSPYILAAFNNLLFGGMNYDKNPEEVEKIIGKGTKIEEGSLIAFYLDEKCEPIMKEDIIDVERIDYASLEIMNEFEALARISFE